MPCDFNRSMQHLVSKSRQEDVADEEVPTREFSIPVLAIYAVEKQYKIFTQFHLGT